MKTNLIHCLPSPTIAFILNTLEKHDLTLQADHVNIPTLYLSFNQALGYTYDLKSFTEYWTEDQTTSDDVNLGELFHAYQSSLDVIFPLFCAKIISKNPSSAIIQGFKNNLTEYFDVCCSHVFEAFKQALIGINDGIYERTGEIQEINKLIFIAAKAVNSPNGLAILNEIDDFYSNTIHINIMCNDVLEWSLSLDETYALAYVEYLD